MTQEDKRRLTEIGLTFALLVTAVCSLQPKQFWQYQLLLAGGSAAGFAFGWYIRKRVFQGLRYFTDAAVLIITAWIGYRIFRSTFLYREVIAILIQGIIFLEVIFSFNFSAPAKSAYMRFLSLLIFIAFPIFPATHSVILAIFYLLSWMATLRFQFSGFLQPLPAKGPRRYYSLAAALACFIISLFLAWFTYSNVYLGSIKKWMFLLDEEVQGIGSVEEGKAGGSGQMDELYGMQDSLQERITNLTLKLDSYEKSREFLYLFSELVKDTENAMEVDKAETGLIDILKSSGIGVEEDAQQAITLTKNYVDKKNALNLQRSKEDIMDMLRKQPVGFLDKVKIISLANKVQQDVSYQQLQKNSQELQEAVQKAFTGKYNQKKELGALARKLADLKAFELYRRKMNDLEQRAPSFSEDIEKNIGDAVSDIKHTQGLDDFKQTAEKIRQLKNDPRFTGQPPGQDLLKKMSEAAGIKLDSFFAGKSEEVRKNAAQNQVSDGQAEEFDNKIDEASKADNSQRFNDKFIELSRQNRENDLRQGQGLNQMLELKTESFKQAKKDKLDELMSKDLPSGARQEIINAAKAMEEKEDARGLEGQLKELVNKIRELEKKGITSAENADKLAKVSTELKDLLDGKLKAQEELKKEGDQEKGAQKSDYLEQLKQAIRNSSLNSKDKQDLEALAEQLFKAQNLSQLEDIKDALENEISALGLKGISPKERKELNDTAKNAAADLEQKLNELENASSEQSRQLQEALKKMQKSQGSPELEKNARELSEKIKDAAQAQGKDKQDQAKLEKAVQELKEALKALLEKGSSEESKERKELNDTAKNAAADLEQKLNELENASSEQSRQLQEALKKMQKSQGSPELEKNARELSEKIKDAAQAQGKDKQDQAKLEKAVQELKEALKKLLKSKAPSPAELKEIKKINEKLEQAAAIKKKFLMNEVLADSLKNIEKLSALDEKKAQELKEKLMQLRESEGSGEAEKIISDLKDILAGGESGNEKKQKEEDEYKEKMTGKAGKEEKVASSTENAQEWKLYILSPSLVVVQGTDVPLKVVAVYKDGYIKELSSELEWSSSNRQVGWVDGSNILHPLNKGRLKIRAVYKGSFSKDMEFNVVEGINAQTVQKINREIVGQ